jgi:hypothetical protein
MTDATGVTVQTQDLVHHADHVRAHAEALGTVLQAAVTTTPGTKSYGYICEMVPAMLIRLQLKVVSGVSAAEEALAGTASGLRKVAASYESTEVRSASAFRQIRRK